MIACEIFTYICTVCIAHRQLANRTVILVYIKYNTTYSHLLGAHCCRTNPMIISVRCPPFHICSRIILNFDRPSHPSPLSPSSLLKNLPKILSSGSPAWKQSTACLDTGLDKGGEIIPHLGPVADTDLLSISLKLTCYHELKITNNTLTEADMACFLKLYKF